MSSLLTAFAASAVFALMAPPAPAQAQFGIPVRLEGYWDRSRDTDQSVLGDLALAVHGRAATRNLGVTDVRAYFGASDGIHLFTDTMRPVFNVTGPAGMVDRFYGAPPGRRVIVTAMYRTDTGGIFLTGLEIEGDDR